MKLSQNKNQNYILIGMPSAGKSTVGVVLSKVMGLSFVDSDIVIQSKTGKKLSELIEEYGVDGFSKIEDEVNTGICGDHMVVATGGSVVFCPNAMKHFSEIGTIVYLNASPAVLDERLGDLDERGVIHKADETVYDIYEARKSFYEKYADVIVNEPVGPFNIEKILDLTLEALKAGE